ncbi:putative transferase CAF17 homolog, mitochondrial [Eucyclogobius newberryi]|uniref:putative transferase CAF17 homolog, mitochondrial n=1 Tax=Eucyclogobius newberryi TaxID=166745 RepID=UPI003B59F0E9
MGAFSFIRGALVSGRSHAFYAQIRGVRTRSYSKDTARCPPNVPGQSVCCPLSHRGLVQIQGQDTGSFLQGIITNDVRLLEEPGECVIYSHMLNVQGRTLYDIMLYSLKEADALCGVLLECDRTLTDSILRHLKLYKIRRKVTFQACPELSVWAVLPGPSKPELLTPEKAVVLQADPRTVKMGWRLVMDSSEDPKDVIASCQKGDVEEYHKHRYTIGLPEGVKDLPPGVALPLESNLVFMNGISFSKGCYIGQELTARTHHTGVIRKRLMPLRLSSPFSAQDLEEGAALQTQGGKPAGKHRSGQEDSSLGLVRTAHAKEELTVKSRDDNAVTLKATVPEWWPEEAKLN